MNEGCQCRIEQTSSGKADADHIGRDRPSEILEYNRARPVRDLLVFR